MFFKSHIAKLIAYHLLVEERLHQAFESYISQITYLSALCGQFIHWRALA